MNEQTVIGQVRDCIIVQQMQHQGRLATTGEAGNAKALALVDQPRRMTDQPAPVLQPVHVLGVDKVDHLIVVFQARTGRDPVAFALQKHHAGAHLAYQASTWQVCIGILAPGLARLALPVNKVDSQFRCIALYGNNFDVRGHGFAGDMREIIAQHGQ